VAAAGLPAVEPMTIWPREGAGTPKAEVVLPKSKPLAVKVVAPGAAVADGAWRRPRS